MANMRAIRSRIKSVQNTQQITKTMKMVAAANLRRTQSGMSAMRTFAQQTQQLMDALLSGGTQYENPLLQPREPAQKVLYVLFVGNRGLCGMYNHTALRFLQQQIQTDGRESSVIVCGRWGKDVIAQTGLNVIDTISDMSDTPSMDQALVLADRLRWMYLNGEADEIHLVYQHFTSVLSQNPMDLQLLPAAPEAKGESPHDFIFEPDQATILANVLQLYLSNTVYSVMLEAKTGEHAARMTAMSTATDSTRELIASLQLHLNRARQAAITTEISEIVGGANALKKKKQ